MIVRPFDNVSAHIQGETSALNPHGPTVTHQNRTTTEARGWKVRAAPSSILPSLYSIKGCGRSREMFAGSLVHPYSMGIGWGVEFPLIVSFHTHRDSSKMVSIPFKLIPVGIDERCMLEAMGMGGHKRRR